MKPPLTLEDIETPFSGRVSATRLLTILNEMRAAINHADEAIVELLDEETPSKLTPEEVDDLILEGYTGPKQPPEGWTCRCTLGAFGKIKATNGCRLHQASVSPGKYETSVSSPKQPPVEGWKESLIEKIEGMELMSVEELKKSAFGLVHGDSPIFRDAYNAALEDVLTLIKNY